MTGFYKPQRSQPCENDFLISSFFVASYIPPSVFCPTRPLCVRINVEFSFGYCPLHSFTMWNSISLFQNRSSLGFSSLFLPSLFTSQCINGLPLAQFSFFVPCYHVMLFTDPSKPRGNAAFAKAPFRSEIVQSVLVRCHVHAAQPKWYLHSSNKCKLLQMANS